MGDYSVVSTVYERLMLAISFEHVCCFSWLPQKVTFDAGPQLQFLFHSDNTNNEWGYKFTVTAMGLPDITISWISDLQLLMARLMGRLASRTLALKSPHGETGLLLKCTNLTKFWEFYLNLRRKMIKLEHFSTIGYKSHKSRSLSRTWRNLLYLY